MEQQGTVIFPYLRTPQLPLYNSGTYHTSMFVEISFQIAVS